MDLNIFIFAFIGVSPLISTAKANFAFENEPIIYDPYASFFASSELDPFAVRNYANEIMNNGNNNYEKMPTNYQRNKYDGKPGYYKASKSELSHLKRFPNIKMQSEFNIPIKIQSKRKYQKMRIPAHKFNNDKNKMRSIRAKHFEDVHFKEQFPLKTNLFNQKLSSNYKDNYLKKHYPHKPLFDEQSIHSERTNRLIPSNFRERPSTREIDLSGEISISSDDEPKQNIRHKQNKFHYLSPPRKYDAYLPQNYHSKEKSIERPGLYEIEPPKNLHTNRPRIVVQNIEVPHQTLLEIADISGPKYDNDYKSNVFNDFYHNSRPKSSDNGIFNNLSNGVTAVRQVGASMSFKPNVRNNEVMGKVFNEPLGSVIKSREVRKPEHHKKYTNTKVLDSDAFSFPIKPYTNDGIKNFNSNPIQVFTNERKPFNSYNQKSDHFDNASPHQQPFNDNDSKNNKIVDVKSDFVSNDDKYERDSEDHEDDREIFSEYNRDQSQKQSHQTQHLGSNPTQRRQPQHSKENSPQDSLSSHESDGEKLDEENSEEWSSSGIPGEPGKDYPLLSRVPLKSEFSCAGKPPGFYADISQKCQVYHQCSSQVQQKFLCPNGTLFNQESLVCEWWYNTQCENSDKLYHKNAQLYQTNNNNQNNNENHNNINEPTNSWNHKRIINNNNDYIENEKMNPNYETNEGKSDSNDYKTIREQYSTPDNDDYDHNEDEVNVDLSNEEMSESRVKLLKTEFTNKLSSNLNSINKTKSQ